MAATHSVWMPLYVADYLGDTMHLTTEQHGAYLLLLMVAWKRGGHVPDDDGQLAQITRMADRWQTHAAATVRAFFTHRDGMLWHGRVEAELMKAKGLVAKKSLAGTAGAAARWHKNGKGMADASASALRQQSQTDAPSHSPSQDSISVAAQPRRRPKAADGERGELKPSVPCPYNEIVALFHEQLPSLPRVKLMPSGRQKALRKMWGWVLSSNKPSGERRAASDTEALAWFGGYFARAAANDFLTGRSGRSADHATWQCDLDFLLTEKGMKQVIEKTEAAA